MRAARASRGRRQGIAAAAAAAACALALAIPLSAWAGAGWLPASAISGAGASKAQVAAAPDGTAVAVWERGSEIEASVRPPGGSFGPAQVISSGGLAVEPQVAIGANGTAVAVWHTVLPDGVTERIETAIRPPGGSFGLAPMLREVVVESSLGETTDEVAQPQVAIDSQGTAIAVWRHARDIPGDPGSSVANIEAAVRPPGGAAFGGYVQLEGINGDSDDNVRLSDPQIGFDSEGGAFVAWAHELVHVPQPPPPDHAIAYSRRPAGDSFPPNESAVPSSTTSTTRLVAPQLAASAQRDVVVVWRSDAGGSGTVFSDIREAGVFTSPQTLSAPGARDPQVASDPGGSAVAVWDETTSKSILASSRPPGGLFGPAVSISGDVLGGETVASPQIAANPFGAMFAVWRHSGTRPGLGIVASLRSPGGSFSAPVGIAPAPSGASLPQVATDSQGDAVVVWQRGGAIEAAVFDGDPPPGIGGGADPGSVADLSAPDVRAFSLTRKRFAVGSEPTALTAARAKRRRTKKGTQFRYSLSEAATVRIAIRRARIGRRVGKSCRKPTRRLRKRRRCTRYTFTGELRRSARTGANTTAFSGRLKRKALRRGRYQATITATDAAGNRSASGRRARFTIVRG